MKKLAAIVIASCTISVTGLWAQAQLDQAREMLRQGKAREAVAPLRQLLETAPKNIDAWLLLAHAYQKVPNLDSAKIAADRVVSLDERNVNGYIILSNVAESRKDIKAAYGALVTGLVERKNDAQLLIALGGLQLRADSVDRAIVVLTQAKEASPNAAVIYDGLGDAYNRQGVPAYAISQYERSVELDSMNATVYDKLGKLYYKERRYNDAARAYARVVILDPSNKAVLLELSRMYLASRPRQYDNAAKYLKLYVDRFPTSNEAWGMYAEALFYLRKFPEALDAANRVMKIESKNGKALRIAATSQFAMKKYKESIDSFRQLQAVDTMKVDDWIRLGDACVELKQYPGAIGAYDEAIKLDPDQNELYNKAGIALMQPPKPNYEMAATMFQKRFTLDTTLRALSAYLNYASCKIAIKEPDSARIAYRTFLSKRSDYPPAWMGLARSLILVSTDSLQASRKAYEEWVKLIPNADEARYKKELAEAYKNIGVAYLVDKKYEQAIPPLKKALQYNDNDDEVHTRLGQAYSLTGQKDEAIKEFQRAFKLNPKNKDAKKGLEMLGIPVD
jgi:tetratricopeptide (TPR) repeat protein